MGSLLPIRFVPLLADEDDDVLDADKKNQNDESDQYADDFVFRNEIDERQRMWYGFSTLQNFILPRLG